MVIVFVVIVTIAMPGHPGLHDRAIENLIQPAHIVAVCTSRGLEVKFYHTTNVFVGFTTLNVQETEN